MSRPKTAQRRDGTPRLSIEPTVCRAIVDDAGALAGIDRSADCKNRRLGFPTTGGIGSGSRPFGSERATLGRHRVREVRTGEGVR